MLWQKSASVAEVARGAGVSVKQASSRAYYLRHLGVGLQRFAGGKRRIDLGALKKAAQSK